MSYPFCHIYTRTDATPSVCFNANPNNGGCQSGFSGGEVVQLARLHNCFVDDILRTP